ncbi:29046_t:CDS:2, partial [Gigaspora margarita]
PQDPELLQHPIQDPERNDLEKFPDTSLNTFSVPDSRLREISLAHHKKLSSRNNEKPKDNIPRLIELTKQNQIQKNKDKANEEIQDSTKIDKTYMKEINKY